MDPKSLRKNTRVDISIPVEVTIHTVGGKNFSGEIVNISMGGAFIQCTVPIMFGEEITFEIKMGDARMLHGKVIDNETWLKKNAPPVVKGKSVVRWARGSQTTGVGVEFTNLSKTEREFLEKLIKYCEQIAVQK